MAITIDTARPSPPAPAGPDANEPNRRRDVLVLLALITALGATLRLIGLGKVALDPFYDAAVRSMSSSWHNFFFGAFEPSGSVSIDKPPVDLWLQVISVKVLGFTPTTLKLPEAMAGTLSVPLLYTAVRRVFGVRAGLCAALAIAVMPIEVLTARSDTMDAVMMALIALGLVLLVGAVQRDSTRQLLAAAAALGLAFDVKLLESLVPLLGLALFAWLGLPGPRRRRLMQVVVAGVVYVVVALSWLTATLLFPAHDRPFAIGSTNGSAWNAAFVFNGYDRIAGKASPGNPITYGRSHHYATRTQSQRDHIPITPPSATRLLTRIGPLSGERLGLELLIGLLLGLPAFALTFRPRARAPDGLEPASERARRVQRAAAVGLTVWLLTGIVLFSQMARLHPRYVEGFTPAVAAVLGIGLAWVSSGRSRARLAVLAGVLLVTVVYALRLLYGTPPIWWVSLIAALGALAVAGAHVLVPDRAAAASSLILNRAALALTLVAVLAVPVWASINAINENVSDGGHVGVIDPHQLRLISAFLRAHQGSARYEVASDSATRVGALIVKDARPVLVLTTYNARTLVTVAQLKHLIATGQVRYGLVVGGCGPHTPPTDAACSAPSTWVRTHGKDVSRQAGLPHPGVLWRLPRSVA